MKTQVELSTRQKQADAKAWLETWIRLGEETLRDVPLNATATEILAADRNRLEVDPQLEELKATYD